MKSFFASVFLSVLLLLSTGTAFGQLVVDYPNYGKALDRVALWAHPAGTDGEYVLDQILVGQASCLPTFKVDLLLEIDVNPTATYITGQVGDSDWRPHANLGTIELGGLDWNQGKVFSRVRSLAADAPFGHYRLRTSNPHSFQATPGCPLDNRVIGAPEVVDFYTAGKRKPTAQNPIPKSEFLGTEVQGGVVYNRLKVSFYLPWENTRVTFFQEGGAGAQLDVLRPQGSSGQGEFEVLLPFNRQQILQTHFKNLVTGESLVVRIYKEGARYSYE